MNKLQKLFDKKILTPSELTRVQNNEEVIELETHAYSNELKGYNWYTATTVDLKKHDVYTKSIY